MGYLILPCLGCINSSMSIELLTSLRFRRRAAGVFKVLADENRLGLLLMLSQGCRDAGCDVKSASAQQTLSDVARSLGISKPTISHHLRLLVRAGLISCTRRGRRVECSVSLAPLQALLEEISTRNSTPGGPARLASRESLPRCCSRHGSPARSWAALIRACPLCRRRE